MSIDQKDYLLSASNYEIPNAIDECSGIHIGEHLIRSVLLTTDLAFINSLQADSVMAVHPFDKSSHMDEVIIDFSVNPVFCDIGGGLLHEHEATEAAKRSLDVGASAVVISKPTPAEVIRNIRSEIDGSLIYTVMFEAEPVKDLAEAGVDIFNVATGEFTAESVSLIRNLLPEIPIMASGGPHNSTIRETIRAGTDAIVFNPPTATEMMRAVFEGFRNNNR
jgi:hypothetical protein